MSSAEGSIGDLGRGDGGVAQLPIQHVNFQIRSLLLPESGQSAIVLVGQRTERAESEQRPW